MKRKQMLGLVLAVSAFVAGNAVIALDLPAIMPEESGWDTYWDRTYVDTCCDQEVAVYSLDVDTCRDYTANERWNVKQNYLNAYAGHIQFIDDATYFYNCHGYVFHDADYWCPDPANWEGTVSPCYYLDSGPLRRWGSYHSAFVGSTYAYEGKCACDILCEHDNAIYGFHWTSWNQH